MVGATREDVGFQYGGQKPKFKRGVEAPLSRVLECARHPIIKVRHEYTGQRNGKILVIAPGLMYLAIIHLKKVNLLLLHFATASAGRANTTTVLNAIVARSACGHGPCSNEQNRLNLAKHEICFGFISISRNLLGLVVRTPSSSRVFVAIAAISHQMIRGRTLTISDGLAIEVVVADEISICR